MAPLKSVVDRVKTLRGTTPRKDYDAMWGSSSTRAATLPRPRNKAKADWITGSPASDISMRSHSPVPRCVCVCLCVVWWV